MASIQSTYFGTIVKTLGEVVLRQGNIQKPTEVTLVYGLVQQRDFNILAGEKESLWAFVLGLDENFTTMIVEIIGAGTIYVQWMGDLFTSSTDATPLGTHETWNTMHLCPHVPFILGSDAILVNPVAADHAADPGPIYHVNEVIGKLYKLEAKNPGASTVKVRLTVIA